MDFTNLSYTNFHTKAISKNLLLPPAEYIQKNIGKQLWANKHKLRGIIVNKNKINEKL